MDSNSHKTLKRSGKRKSNINKAIGRDYDIRVLIHEICHCVLYSYGLLYDIHKAVKKDYWILAEEWICNFLYDYGLEAQQVGIDMLDEKFANLISLHCTRSFMCDIMILHVYDLVFFIKFFKHVFIFFVLAIKTHSIMKEWSINRRRLERVSRLNSLMVERREIGDVCSKRTNSFYFFFANRTCS